MEYFTKNNKSGHKTKEKWLIKNNNELYLDVINHSSHIKDITFKERIWLFMNKILTIPTCSCGVTLKFKKSLNEGYGKYCSIICTNKDSEHIKNVKDTNQIRYNGPSPIHSDIVKQKIKYTTTKLYGVDNIFKDTEFIKVKTFEKHGVTHISKLQETKDNITNTNLERYNVKSPLMLQSNRKIGLTSRQSVFNDKYIKLNIIETNGDDITITCDKCLNDYIINRALLWYRVTVTTNPCLVCHPKKMGISIAETELSEFITSLNVDIVTNERTILNGKELDIYIPSHKIAIEYNGLYWHSEKYVNNEYHINKTILCDDSGIKLIHIFEDEWLNKRAIVESRIRNVLGLTKTRLYGRKCVIKDVPTAIKTKFLSDNHIQGAVGSKVNLGLYYDNELVSLMTFSSIRSVLGNTKTHSDDWELIRFCNKLDTTVIGGASRLLKYFINNNTPREIISYADRRWSTGNLYETLGFSFNHYTNLNWFIVNNGNREHRIKYQKHKLVEMGFDVNKTAHQITLENKLFRIYDCGTIKYSKKFV